MTTKAVKALFWKEYRQQIMLLVALFLLGIIFQLSSYTMSLFQPSAGTYFWTLGMFVTALYAAGAAGVLFAREHDEKTFGFLRSLPLTADTILVGKLTWLLGSTLLLGIALGLESLVWVAIAGTYDSGATIFGVMGVAVVEALCWGLFWSVRSKSQLNALLATFLSASVGAYVMAVLWNRSFGGSGEILDAYAGGAPLRLLLAGVVGTIAIFDARKWLYRQFGKPLDTLTPEQLTVQSKKMLAKPKRGEMRWLLWHAFRQSRASFGYLAIVFAMMIVLLVACRWNWFVSDTTFELAVFLGIAAFAGLIFCSSVFFRDQQNKAAAMLTNVGVSPGKLWWSRILVFGFAYAIYCIPLVVAYMSVAFGKNGEFFRFFLCYEPMSYYYWEHMESTIQRQSMLVAVTLFGAIFCFGQMISLYLRSVLAAMAVVVGMFCGVFFWVMIVKYLLGYTGLIWAVWPVLIACLVASRLRAANWQRGRNTWRAWRPPLLTVGVPALVILCVIPFVRVFSVPSVYLGYAQPEILKKTDDMDSNYYNMYYYTEIDENGRGWNIAYVQPNEQNTEGDIVERVRNAINRNHACISNYESSFRFIFSRIDDYTLDDNVSPEMLRQLITLLEDEPRTRPTLRSRIMRSYIRSYRELEHPSLWVRFVMPWEKYRAHRRLDLEFQHQSQLADLTEELVYHNRGSFSLVGSRQSAVHHLYDRQYNEILYNWTWNGLGRFLETHEDNSVSAWDVMERETRRRATILLLALQAYYLEHGELPETLAELEDGYLTEVPLVPVTNEAFEYHPHPSPDDTGGYSYSANLDPNDYRGIPYLRVPVARTLSNFLPVARESYPLRFLKNPKAETEE